MLLLQVAQDGGGLTAKHFCSWISFLHWSDIVEYLCEAFDDTVSWLGCNKFANRGQVYHNVCLIVNGLYVCTGHLMY